MYTRPDALYKAPTADAMYKTPRALSLALTLTPSSPYNLHPTPCTLECMEHSSVHGRRACALDGMRVV
jgi:hypothetical protein